jgi:type IV secretion system pilin
MRKLIAKIGLFIIISTILASFNFAAYAEECDPDSSYDAKDPCYNGGTDAESDALKDDWTEWITKMADSACVKTTTTSESGEKTPCDFENVKTCYSNKVITYIEEPFGEPSKNQSNEEPYIVKRCVRNTWVSKDKGLSVTQMLDECMGEEKGPTDWNPSTNKGDKLYCQEVYAIISDGGTAMISGYIGMLYRWGASIVGLIAVLVIVISGMQIATAGGDSQAIEEAKGRILGSIGGIVVLFLSGLILYTVNPNFFTLS